MGAASVEVVATRRCERIVAATHRWTILSFVVLVITGAIAIEAIASGVISRIWQQLPRYMHASSNAILRMTVISLLTEETFVLATTVTLAIAVSVEVVATKRCERIVKELVVHEGFLLRIRLNPEGFLFRM